MFAASSLTNPFEELEKTFEQEHADVDVVLSFESSSTLATQITEGSPADVLATADQKSMQIIVDAGDNGSRPAVLRLQHDGHRHPAGQSGGRREPGRPEGHRLHALRPVRAVRSRLG